MNVFEGTFRPDGTGYRFEDGALALHLADVPGGDGFPDRVALGVRPENLRRVEELPPGVGGAIELEVDLVEPLGSEIYVHGNAGARRIVARLGPERPVEPGTRLRLAPDPDHVHFFDAASGVALRPSVHAVAG